MLSVSHRFVVGIASSTLALLLATSSAHAQLVGGQWETKWQFDGQAASNRLGRAVSGAGDVDGDGFDDVIVGAQNAAPGGLSDAGSAYVFSGATGTLIWQFDGQSAADQLGNSVAGAGDVDGDGFDDVIVGVVWDDPGSLFNAGSARVYSGATGSLIWQFDGQIAFSLMGYSVSGAGDVDGDGFDDVIVGAIGVQPAGSSFVYSGATGSLIWRFDGLTAGENMGGAVSDAGDVDGDGFGDVIVGAWTASPGGVTQAGSAYVYSGATGNLIWRFDGLGWLESMGYAVSGAGDVDGNGFDDLIVGARADPGGLLGAGSAYVYSGATGNLIWQFDGQATNDHLGWTVSGAGDVDRDGFDDVIVGASGADPGGQSSAGSAYVYSGITGSLIRQFDGEAAMDLLGVSVSGAGDVDGDGFADVIAGAEWADPGGLSLAGSAYVYSLSPFLHTDSAGISYSTNQPVQFDLDFPATEAGVPYAVLVSRTGNGPSVFHGLDIPLTQDAYFQQFLGNPNLHGVLNINAHADLDLRLHRQTPPGAIGKTLYLAAATFDTGTQSGRMSSVVHYLQITP